jgi:hypothetical protein
MFAELWNIRSAKKKENMQVIDYGNNHQEEKATSTESYIIPSYIYWRFFYYQTGFFQLHRYFVIDWIIFIVFLTGGIAFGMLWQKYNNMIVSYPNWNDLRYVLITLFVCIAGFLDYVLWEVYRKKVYLKRLQMLGSNIFPTCPSCFRSFSDKRMVCPSCDIPLRAVPEGKHISNEIVPISSGWYGTKVRLRNRFVDTVS